MTASYCGLIQLCYSYIVTHSKLNSCGTWRLKRPTQSLKEYGWYVVRNQRTNRESQKLSKKLLFSHYCGGEIRLKPLCLVSLCLIATIEVLSISNITSLISCTCLCIHSVNIKSSCTLQKVVCLIISSFTRVFVVIKCRQL